MFTFGEILFKDNISKREDEGYTPEATVMVI